MLDMRQLRKLTVLLLTLGLFGTACGSDGSAAASASAAARDRSPQVSDSDTSAVADALNEFAFDLYNQMRSHDAKVNLWFSPQSIRVMLAMAMLGSAGDTRLELRKALHLTLPDERLYAALNALDLSLTQRKNVTVEEGNWIADFSGGKLKKPYTERLAKHFGVAVDQMSQRDLSEAARQINQAVEKRTHGRVKNAITADTLEGVRDILINTTYFKGEWKTSFDPEDTKPRPFERLDGSTHDVPMMSTETKDARFTTTDSATMVEIPYKGDMSMAIVMPDSGKFDDVVSTLDAATWQVLSANLNRWATTVELPKFELKPQETNDITNDLKALGLTTMFDPDRADFTPMSRELLYMAWVLHRADLTVDEKGTIASAATAGKFVDVGSDLDGHIRIDKPFVVAIVDDNTGAILFLGQITNPGGS